MIGDIPKPHFSYFLWRRERSKETFQGVALLSSINPNPFFIRRGFNLYPKPLCPLQGRGLTAPPVALTFRYPKTIKGLGWFSYRLARRESAPD